jgi:hypothetical protein
MKHPIALGTAIASLLVSTSTYAFEPILSPTADDEVAGVEWVRLTLESSFDGTEVRPAAWSIAAGRSEHFGGTSTLASLKDTRPGLPQAASLRSGTVYDSREAGLTSQTTAPEVADSASVEEEVVVLGVRRREPQWHPPTVEEPENDWRGSGQAARIETGRIEVGRAVIYQDLGHRRRYDMFRDEFRDPRPQQSVYVGLGRRTIRTEQAASGTVSLD